MKSWYIQISQEFMKVKHVSEVAISDLENDELMYAIL